MHFPAAKKINICEIDSAVSQRLLILWNVMN